MSGASVRRSLVSVAWLRAHVSGTTQAPHNVVPVDASWHMVSTATVAGAARRDFDAERIPGSRYFDLDGVFSDSASPLPHTLVSRAAFERGVRQMGIRNDTHVVLYDRSNTGTFSAARAWWMFRGFGHPGALVSLLDGGFRAWRAAGAELETGALAAPVAESDYVVEKEFDERLLRNFDQSERQQRNTTIRSSSCPLVLVRANESNPSELVIDARSAERFGAKVDEPRAGLRRGNIPGSVNVPFGSVLNADGTFKSDLELRAIFAAVGANDSRPLVFSCGSGVTACVDAFAAHTAGITEGVAAVYDGSWTEYGGRC